MNSIILISILFVSTTLVQVTEEWVAKFNGPDNLGATGSKMVVDISGNAIVTGIVTKTCGKDIATIKYNSAGFLQWASYYDGDRGYCSDDTPLSIETDNAGNIFVFGEAQGPDSIGLYWVTIKYSPNGSQQWISKFHNNDLFGEVPISMVVDNNGNAVVTGYILNGVAGTKDYVTIKYSGSSGAQQWIRTYNGAGNLFDEPRAIAIDDSNNVYVTGRSQTVSSVFNMATIKYNAAGVQQWVATCGGPGNNSIPNYIVSDDSNNIYVNDVYSSKIIKYNSNGNQQWIANYSGPGFASYVYIVVDEQMNVYATGNRFGVLTDIEILTTKFNPAGIQQWYMAYSKLGSTFSTTFGGLDIDNDGYIYITRNSSSASTNWDIVTLKYSPAGELQWVAEYGYGGTSENAMALDIDNNFNVFVAGSTYENGVNYEYLTIKYSQGLKITSPVVGEKWIAGETDTIKWTGGQSGQLLDIEYSTDNGGTYSIAQLGVLAETGKYAWTIPKTILSTKVKIRLNDVLDTLVSATSDSFKIKPYIITRIDTSTGDYIAYNINTNRWGFRNAKADVWPRTWFQQFNYQGTDPFTGQQYPQITAFSIAPDSIHPDWVSWVNTFGVNACYQDVSSALYSPTAVTKWQFANSTWKGSCFGIAISNALAFYKKSQFQARYPSFPDFINPINVTSNPNVIKVVNELFTHQHGNPHRQYRSNVGLTKTPNQTLDDIRTMLKEDNVKIRTLSLMNNNGSGGHAILGYKLEKHPSASSKFRVFVYDNSNHDSLNAFVEIDTTLNTWQTYYDWINWGGDSLLYLRDAAENYLSNDNFSASPVNSSPFILDDSTLQIFLDETESVSITNLIGESIGYSNGVLVNDIPNAFPFINENGSEDPPLGYELGYDNYSILLNEFNTGNFGIALFTSNKSFAYERDDAISTQADRLFFDGGVSAINPDAETKTVTLLNIINETTQEKLFIVSELELAQNDSVKIVNPDDSTMTLENFGSAKNYKLELTFVSPSGQGVFINNNISLAQNSTHNMVPDWGNLNNLQLMIYIETSEKSGYLIENFLNRFFYKVYLSFHFNFICVFCSLTY